MHDILSKNCRPALLEKYSADWQYVNFNPTDLVVEHFSKFLQQ